MRIIDVIDHTKVATDELVWREPQNGSGDWRMGSQVIVGESQAAVFVRAGEALDVLGPGRHTLSVANLPILSSLVGMVTNGRTPFTADLYFINLKDMPQVGWGTTTPIVIETPGRGLGVSLLITHGVIDISVADPMRFLKQYAVGRPSLFLADIQDRIKTALLGEVAGLLTKSGVQSVPDANKLLGELEGGMLAQLNEKFAALGMRIKAFEANPFQTKNVSINELRDYVSLDMWERAMMSNARAQALQDAAKNPGMGGAMVGAGLGLGVGQQLGAAMMPPQGYYPPQQGYYPPPPGYPQQPPPGYPQQPPPPAAPAAPAAPANPTTKAEAQALLDNLDMKLANGEISESTYKMLSEKWQKRMDDMK
jgi:membrane protease subunit (stomatin/prohibitin family)